MNHITQYQSARPNVGIIYGGLVAHTANLHKSIAERPAEPKPTRDTTAQEHYITEIESLMRLADEFLKDKKGREVFAVSEIAEYLGLSSNHISRHCPKHYFAANGRNNLMFRDLLKIGGANVRGIAIKIILCGTTLRPLKLMRILKSLLIQNNRQKKTARFCNKAVFVLCIVPMFCNMVYNVQDFLIYSASRHRAKSIHPYNINFYSVEFCCS